MNSALLRALASWGWLLIALLVSAVVTLLAAVGGFDRADLLFQSYLYDDGAPRWEAPVTVVEIDDASLQAIGPYPWKRAAYVRLLQALSEAERRPAVVAFDVGFFDLTEEDPAALAGALDAFPSLSCPSHLAQHHPSQRPR